MDTKLKAIQAGHRGMVTKYWRKFEDIQQSWDIDEGEPKSIHENIVNKKNILKELNEKIMDLVSAEEVAEEIQDADEYMFTLESKLLQIRKLIQTSQPATQNLARSASTLLNPNADSFSPAANTNSSLTNSNSTHHNVTEIHTQPNSI